LQDNTIVKVIATDPLAEADFEYYCKESNFTFLDVTKEDEKIIIRYKFKKNT